MLDSQNDYEEFERDGIMRQQEFRRQVTLHCKTLQQQKDLS